MSKYGLFFISIFLSGTLQANAFEIVGAIPAKISTSSGLNKSVSPFKMISLQKIKLSPAAKRALKGRIEELEIYAHQQLLYKAVSSAPVRIYLGMNGTPVLDQGYHGSCVTFAITGAIDAAIGKGDYISQLCSLQLGNYLVKRNLAYYSGWDGSWGTSVLKQLNKYGIITKSYQLKYGCPKSVKQYPLYTNSNVSKQMSISEYTASSRPLSSYASWIVLADGNTAFNPNFNTTTFFGKVKLQLRAGRRVTMGFLLDAAQGDAGALGTRKKHFDTWVLTASILKKAKAGTLYAGHEMIIIGYDDLATSRGSDGKISKGLFTLRNSWGPNAGDGGNYYMSYDYFKALCDEASAIVKKK